MPKMQVELSEQRTREASRFIIDAINKGQRSGFTIDEMIAAALFMAGSCIKQRGGILNLDKPLQEALPPIALGYGVSARAEAWQIEGMRGN